MDSREHHPTPHDNDLLVRDENEQPHQTEAEALSLKVFQRLLAALDLSATNKLSEKDAVEEVKACFQGVFKGITDQTKKAELYNAILPLIDPDKLLLTLTSEHPIYRYLALNDLTSMPTEVLNDPENHFRERIPYKAKFIFEKVVDSFSHMSNINQLKEEIKKALDSKQAKIRKNIELEKQLLRELSPYFLSLFFLMYENLARYYIPSWVRQFIAGLILIPLFGVILLDVCKIALFDFVLRISLGNLISHYTGYDFGRRLDTYNLDKVSAAKIDYINGWKSQSAKTANMTDEAYLIANPEKKALIDNPASIRGTMHIRMGGAIWLQMMAESCFSNLVRPLSGEWTKGIFFFLRLFELAFIIVALLVVAALELSAKLINVATQILEAPAFLISMLPFLVLNTPLLIKDGIAQCCGCGPDGPGTVEDSTVMMTPNRRGSARSVRGSNEVEAEIQIRAEQSTSSAPPGSPSHREQHSTTAKMQVRMVEEAPREGEASGNLNNRPQKRRDSENPLEGDSLLLIRQDSKCGDEGNGDDRIIVEVEGTPSLRLPLPSGSPKTSLLASSPRSFSNLWQPATPQSVAASITPATVQGVTPAP